MLDRRLFANFDWVLLSIVIMLCAVGIVAMYSATMGNPQLSRFLPRQVIWMVLGLALALVATVIDYRIWARFGPLLHLGAVLLLILVLMTLLLLRLRRRPSFVQVFHVTTSALSDCIGQWVQCLVHALTISRRS